MTQKQIKRKEEDNQNYFVIEKQPEGSRVRFPVQTTEMLKQIGAGTAKVKV